MTGPVAESWVVAPGLSGYQWRAAEARASLLLQHGYAEYAERYVESHCRLIPNLVAIGFNVFAFDLRGHGRSVGRRGAVNVEQAVQDHRAARAILKDIGKPLYLFGHSLGGLVTAASAARDQRDLAGVVLSAPALLLSGHPLLKLLAGGLAKVAPTLGVLPPQPSTGLSRDPDEVERFDDDPRVYHGRMPVLTGSTAMTVAGDSWPHYRRWQVPTLTLHGSADTYTDPKGSALFNALIRSSKKTFVPLEGGRHELLIDLDRERVLARILTWLQQSEG